MDSMTEDYHIDMSGRLYKERNVGVACVNSTTVKHKGCALKGNLIKHIHKNLCVGSIY